MKRLILAAPLLLAACTTAQVATVQSYQDKIAGACSVAMTVAPIAGPYATWIIGGCATEAAIAKLALDPHSLAWVNGLVKNAKGAQGEPASFIVRDSSGAILLSAPNGAILR